MQQYWLQGSEVSIHAALCQLSVAVPVTMFHSPLDWFLNKMQKLLLLLLKKKAKKQWDIAPNIMKRLSGIKLTCSRSLCLPLINLQCLVLKVSHYIPDILLFRRCINWPIRLKMQTRSGAVFAAHISEESIPRSRWVLCGPVCAESHCGLSSLWT